MRIFMIGLMGAGKTTVGRKLAQLLDYDFADTDNLIEQRTGVSIERIFEIEGEAGFRVRESNVLKELSDQPNLVVSTGGGVICRQDNRELLLRSGTVIYLKAAEELLWKRVRNGQNRPLLNRGQPRTILNALRIERDPLYTAVAHIVYRIEDDSANRVARNLRAQLDPAATPQHPTR